MPEAWHHADRRGPLASGGSRRPAGVLGVAADIRWPSTRGGSRARRPRMCPAAGRPSWVCYRIGPFHSRRDAALPGRGEW